MDHTLSIPALDAGFFANLNNVLSVLSTCLGRDGARAARVDWTIRPGMSHFTYGEVGTNVWDRFFEPLPFENPPEREIEAPVFPDYSMTNVYAYRLYKRDREWRTDLHRLYQKFVKPLPHIIGQVEKIVGFAKHPPLIGVHARHPGHSVENLFDIPTVSIFLAHTHRLLRRYPDASVFLATDAADILRAFEIEFGGRVITQQGVERSSDARQVHHGASPSETRGLQVLVDALTLARCDAMLHVTSNVATAVGYINPKVRMHFCESRSQAVIGHALAAMMRVRAFAHGIRALRARKYGL